MVARDFQENVDPNYYLNVGIKKVTINCLWASLLTYIDEIFFRNIRRFGTNSQSSGRQIASSYPERILTIDLMENCWVGLSNNDFLTSIDLDFSPEFRHAIAQAIQHEYEPERLQPKLDINGKPMLCHQWFNWIQVSFCLQN